MRVSISFGNSLWLALFGSSPFNSGIKVDTTWIIKVVKITDCVNLKYGICITRFP